MSDYDTFDDGLARFVDPVAVSDEPFQADPALRPRNLDEYVGQARAVENLRVARVGIRRPPEITVNCTTPHPGFKI